MVFDAMSNMAARTRDRDSAGRLLRVIADCDLYHMEAAIASLKRVKTGIRSESLLKPSGGDDVDALERTAEGRVLSLSDHKRIARLQAALTAVANAYGGGNGVEGSTPINSNRNLVRTVAGAAIMQATRDCTASRSNCCVLGSQAEKLLFLLDWMVIHEGADDDLVQPGDGYVRQLLLEWIQPSAEKQNQLAACLALFELLQRRRQRLTKSASGSECSTYLLGDQVELYLEALRSIVERGTLPVADSSRVKPSKLALMAFETLVLLCGDVAAYYSTATDATKITLTGGQLMKNMVESARFAVVVLRQWHLHSIRRQFLGYALQNLQVYAEICQNLLASASEFEGDTATGSTSDAVAGLDVLCWHWCATAPLLCTRSDVSSLIKKNQAHEVLARNLRKWAAGALSHKPESGRRGMTANPELVYSQLRYLCLLMDAIGGVKGCSKAFEEFRVDVKANFVFFFVYGLSVANKSGDEAALQLTLNVLRAVLLPSNPLHLLNSRDEEQELLSQLLREVSSGSIARGISYHDTQAQTELELFIVDFIISRKLFIADLVMWMQDSQSQTIQRAISLTRTLLYQLDHAAFQEPIYRHWRQVLSPVVLALLDHSSYHVRRLVISCLPSLDPVSCIAGLCAAGVLQTENNTVTSALGYLFNTSTQHSLESMMTWFIDACRYGILQLQLISEKSPVSPHEWSNYAAEQNGNTKAKAADDEDRKEQQEQLLSVCFGSKGWSNHVRSSNARTQVLSILQRKIFGSPRDTLLLRMLREFVGCGWVDRDVFGALEKQLTSRMMNLQRLTEDTLDDNSASAAKTVEGLLFSRLAPLLVLRMLPRDIFGADSTQALLCERDDLDHLNEYIDRQQHVDDSESQTTDSTDEILCHILALSVVDPLEFKEVKMLATEVLAKFPPPTVVPFVFAHLLAFLREAGIYRKNSTSLIVNAESIPDGCGLVTAKLMVYYLNRVLAEDDHAYKDQEITMKALVVLAQIMGILCTQESSLAVDASLLADLQRGCIDCVGLILSRLDADDKPVGAAKTPTDSAASLVNLLLTWIFDPNCGEKIDEYYEPRVQELLHSLWSEAQHDELPLQVRICCCNVLLSAISRLENSALERWKSQGFISRVAVATEACFEEDVAAGGLQIIFSFLYKSSELFSMENSDDLQLVRNCFDATVSCLESTRSESVAMSGLKVIGALIGKLPSFVGTLPPAEVQRLVDGCLISVRDRRLSPVVSELAQSLLQAMTPP